MQAHADAAGHPVPQRQPPAHRPLPPANPLRHPRAHRHCSLQEGVPGRRRPRARAAHVVHVGGRRGAARRWCTAACACPSRSTTSAPSPPPSRRTPCGGSWTPTESSGFDLSRPPLLRLKLLRLADDGGASSGSSITWCSTAGPSRCSSSRSSPTTRAMARAATSASRPRTPSASTSAGSSAGTRPATSASGGR